MILWNGKNWPINVLYGRNIFFHYFFTLRNSFERRFCFYFLGYTSNILVKNVMFEIYVTFYDYEKINICFILVIMLLGLLSKWFASDTFMCLFKSNIIGTS